MSETNTGIDIINENVEDELIPPEPHPTPGEEVEWERQRKEVWEEKTRPYREFKQQQDVNTHTIAEHDDLTAELMYEVTMLQFGEEV